MWNIIKKLQELIRRHKLGLILALLSIGILFPRLAGSLYGNIGNVALSQALFTSGSVLASQPGLPLCRERDRIESLPGQPAALKRIEYIYLNGVIWDRTNVMLHRSLGKVYLAQGNISKAIESLEANAGVSSNNDVISFLLGVAYYQIRDTERAIYYWRIANAGSYWLQAGWICLKARRLPEAQDAFVLTSRIDPMRGEAYYGQGESLFLRGKYEEALLSYQRVARINPTYWKAYVRIGDTMEALQRREDAALAYETALSINPTSSWALSGLAKVAFERTGQLTEAVCLLQQAIEVNPDDIWPYIHLSELYQSTGDTWSAVAWLSRAEVKFPTSNLPHTFLGIFYLQHDQLDRAVTHFLQALKYNPEDTDAHYGLGQVYERQGNLRCAGRHYAIASELAPDREDYAEALGKIRSAGYWDSLCDE